MNRRKKQRRSKALLIAQIVMIAVLLLQIGYHLGCVHVITDAKVYISGQLVMIDVDGQTFVHVANGVEQP